jgi:hypothetical protein
MMLRTAAFVFLLAAAAPAHATAWYYVDSAKDLSNISFIDKDSVTTNADGNNEAMMYSVLAEVEDNAVAYRFKVEANCTNKTSRLISAEIFDPGLKSTGATEMMGDWEGSDPGTQGQTIIDFICSKGATATGAALGSALPFDKGRTMLAERRSGKVQ